MLLLISKWYWLAAERRKNVAHGVSRRYQRGGLQAPEGRRARQSQRWRLSTVILFFFRNARNSC